MTEPVNKCVISYSCTAHIWQYCRYFQKDDMNACKHYNACSCINHAARLDTLERDGMILDDPETMEKSAEELMERSEDLKSNCERLLSDLEEFERRSKEKKIRIGEKR
jgi:hypothetical protein